MSLRLWIEVVSVVGWARNDKSEKGRYERAEPAVHAEPPRIAPDRRLWHRVTRPGERPGPNRVGGAGRSRRQLPGGAGSAPRAPRQARHLPVHERRAVARR